MAEDPAATRFGSRVLRIYRSGFQRLLYAVPGFNVGQKVVLKPECRTEQCQQRDQYGGGVVRSLALDLTVPVRFFHADTLIVLYE